jgi:hypothetical protein
MERIASSAGFSRVAVEHVLSDAHPHLLGDFVGGKHGDLRIDFQMEVGMVAHTGFAREALFYPPGTLHCHRNRSDPRHGSIVGHRVHQVQAVFENNPQRSGRDDQANQKRAVMVGVPQCFGTPERQRNAGQRDEPGKHVQPVIGRVGPQRGTSDAARVTELHCHHAALRRDGKQHRVDGPRFRHVGHVGNAGQPAPGDQNARVEQEQSEQQAGQSFHATVAVRMVLVRGAGRQDQTHQDQAGREHVCRRFEAIGQHGCRMPPVARVDLHRPQAAADEHPDDGDPDGFPHCVTVFPQRLDRN